MVHVVVFQNKGTPIQPPKYYNPYYGDPKIVPLISGTPDVDMQLLLQPGLRSRRREEVWGPLRPIVRNLLDAAQALDVENAVQSLIYTRLCSKKCKIGGLR